MQIKRELPRQRQPLAPLADQQGFDLTILPHALASPETVARIQSHRSTHGGGMHHQRACCAAAGLLLCRTARARAGFDAAAFLQAKLFFRAEELVTRLLGRLLRAAELLAHALFLGDAALALCAGKQIALTALD